MNVIIQNIHEILKKFNWSHCQLSHNSIKLSLTKLGNIDWDGNQSTLGECDTQEELIVYLKTLLTSNPTGAEKDAHVHIRSIISSLNEIPHDKVCIVHYEGAAQCTNQLCHTCYNKHDDCLKEHKKCSNYCRCQSMIFY